MLDQSDASLSLFIVFFYRWIGGKINAAVHGRRLDHGDASLSSGQSPASVTKGSIVQTCNIQVLLWELIHIVQSCNIQVLLWGLCAEH